MTWRRTIEDGVEDILRTLFWTDDFGATVVLFHQILILVFILSLIATVYYPSLIYVVIPLVLIVTLKHLVLGVCILSSIERRINGAPMRVTEPLLALMGLPETKTNIRRITQTIFVTISLLMIWRLLSMM